MTKAAKIREFLKEKEVLVTPAVYDGLSAKIAESVGFKALHISGYAVAASLGFPDMGLVTLSEMVTRAGYICNAVELPVTVDVDSGHGNALNVVRTVREFEAAGVAGIQIEDQVSPKRCASLPGKQVVSIEEMVLKIKAACDARKNKDTLIIARTDAMQTDGIEEAIKRGNAYREAGADVVLVIGGKTREEMIAIVKGISAPLKMLQSESGLLYKFLPIEELQQIGFKMVTFSLSTLLASAFGIKSVLEEIINKRTSVGYLNNMYPWSDMNRLLGFDEWTEIEQKFVTNYKK